MQRQGGEAEPQEHQGERRHVRDGDTGKEERSAPDEPKQGEKRPGPHRHLLAAGLS